MNHSRGKDFILEVKESMPGYEFSVAFDVGANVGQSLKSMHKEFKDIYTFEPVSSTFVILKERCGAMKNVRFFNLAFGSIEQRVDMLVSNNSTTNRILSSSESAHESGTESVKVLRLDDFCLANSVDFISYLKIDAEGYDLEVLKGSSSMLSSSSIDFIEAEVGMHKGNSTHVGFDKCLAFMSAFDYSFFGFYDQNLEFYHRMPCLRRANVVWISNSLCQRYRL